MRKFFIFSLLFVSLSSSLYSQDRDQVYAGVIFHVIKYLAWPSYHKDYIKVGVVEDVRLTRMLNKVFKGKKVHFKALKAEDCMNFNDLSDYHVMFFSKKGASLISKIVDNHVLTISELNEKMTANSVFNIIENKGKIELELYMKNLSKMNFQVSEQLKKIASIR